MHRYHKTLIASGLFMLVSTGAAGEVDDAGDHIRALMTPEQYQAAGLDKLSEAEREVLYRWLQHFKGIPEPEVETAQPAAAPAASTAIPATVSKIEAQPPAQQAAPGATATPAPSAAGADGQVANAAIEENFGLPDPVDPAKAAYQLHATIKEPFRGWSGKTVFYLDNGQIWQQRTSGRHTYTGDDNGVVIRENALGFYEMRLIAADRSVGVKRIK